MFALGSVAIRALFKKKLGFVTVQKSESVVFLDEPIPEARREHFDHLIIFE